MKKTSVYLTDNELDALRRISEREGKSQALVLREAIVAYDEAYETAQDRNFAIFNTFEGDGTSIADVPDEELLRGFGEDSDPDWGLYHPGRTREPAKSRFEEQEPKPVERR